jgi:hypothetical protein
VTWPRVQGELHLPRHLCPVGARLSLACTPPGIQAKTTAAPIARASWWSADGDDKRGRLVFLESSSREETCGRAAVPGPAFTDPATPQPVQTKGNLTDVYEMPAKDELGFVTCCCQESWIVHGYDFATEIDVRFFSTSQPAGCRFECRLSGTQCWTRLERKEPVLVT